MLDHFLGALLEVNGATAYWIIFGILLACGLGFPMPEDITLFVAGLMVYYGDADIVLMIVVSFLGVIVGDSIIFFLGRHYGQRLLQRKFFQKILHAERMAAVQKKIHERGNAILFAGRFMPGFRAPIYFTCGTMRITWKTFLFFDGMAALISVPTIVYLTYHFGDEFDYIRKVIQRVEHAIFFVILGIIFVVGLKYYLSKKRKNA